MIEALSAMPIMKAGTCSEFIEESQMMLLPQSLHWGAVLKKSQRVTVKYKSRDSQFVQVL